MEPHRKTLQALGPEIIRELELTPLFLSTLLSWEAINQAEYGRLKVSKLQASLLSKDPLNFVIIRTWSESRDGRRRLKASSPFFASRASTYSVTSFMPCSRLPKTIWHMHGPITRSFLLCGKGIPVFRKLPRLMRTPWCKWWQSSRITIQRKSSTGTSRSHT